MSQLTSQQQQIRMNIRNCYLVATQEEIENEIERRTDREDFIAVRFLKELIEEINNEAEAAATRPNVTARLVCSNYPAKWLNSDSIRRRDDICDGNVREMSEDSWTK